MPLYHYLSIILNDYVFYNRISISYRRMFRGSNQKLEESYFNKTANSSSILTETTNQVFQKEIDNYTRILEQDKRKFFRAQENRNDLVKDHSTKQKELDTLKSKQYKTQTLRKKGEVKILEGQLDQAINSYNQIIAYNKQLKNDIDELRKEKLNQKEGMRRLTSRIEEYSSAVGERQLDIVKKQQNIELSKQDILKIKHQNQHQAKCFREDVTVIQGSLSGGKSRSYLFKRRSEFDPKGDATDTQPLVKYRLKNLINSNKEKLKIVENYKKGMHAIWQSFEDIKQESGGDLQEITNSLIKHEEQNHFIYEYIHKLNKEIEDLNDHNATIRQQIEDKKKENHQNMKKLKDTPEKTKSKLEEQQLVASYQSKITQFQTFLQESTPIITDLLASLAIDTNIEISQFSIQNHLAQIESLIMNQYTPDDSSTGIYKQEMTKYAKLPPSLNDQLREPKEQKLLDSDKFHEFACDYWEKKKQK